MCIYIYYKCAQTLTKTSPHCAPLHQRHSSYAMSFHAMLCYAPNEQHTIGTLYVSFGLTVMLILNQPLVSFGLTAQ